MSAGLVVSGQAGTATRTTPRDRVRLFGTTVDEWQLHAAGPNRPLIHMATIESGRETVLAIISVDPMTRDQCEWLNLPAALAARLLAADLMPVDDHDHARAVMRELARAAVDGVIPITPGPDYARSWATASRALCALIVPSMRGTTAAVGSRTG